MGHEATPQARAQGRRDSESTRQALIAAGATLFSERGFDGATVDAIARIAGVNKAMISYHFAGKQGLYNAILTRDFEWAQARLAELDARTIPADTKLARFVAVFGELHLRHPHLSTMMLREAMSGGRHLDATLMPHIRRIFERVQAILAQGEREGTLRRVDPLMTHQIVLGSLAFFFAVRPLRDRMIAEGIVAVEPPDPARFVSTLQELLARGLAKES